MIGNLNCFAHTKYWSVAESGLFTSFKAVFIQILVYLLKRYTRRVFLFSAVITPVGIYILIILTVNLILWCFKGIALWQTNLVSCQKKRQGLKQF